MNYDVDNSYNQNYLEKINDESYFRDIPGDIEDFVFYFYNRSIDDYKYLK